MALLRFLRVVPGSAVAVQEAVDHLGPDALVDEARLHGLSALVRHTLAGAQVALPAGAAERLSREALGSAGATLRSKALLWQALDALGGAGIDPVLLKGYALGARFYPEPLLRPTSDVDLLVHEREVARASAALRLIGLRPMEEASEAYHREHHHHVTFVGRGSVELHFRLLTGFGAALPGDEPLARARELVLEGRKVRVLAPDDELLYLAVHAAGHLFARLAWLYDLKLLLLRNEPDWEQLAARARTAGLGAPAAVAFSLARRSLAAKVPVELERLWGTTLWHRLVTEQVFSDARLEAAPWLSRKWVTFALTTALASDPVAAGRYLGHNTARGLKRRLAKRFPDQVPAAWRG